MRKKIFSFMLMAVGLLISGNVGAQTNVANLQQLRDAFANGSGEIVLTNDIDIDLTIVDPLYVTTAEPITFDLNGYTISGSDKNTDRGIWEPSQTGLINIKPQADVTIIATGGGAVKVNENSKHLLALCSYGNLVIKGGDFYGTYGSAIMTKEEGADVPSKKIVIEGDASFDSKEGWTVSIEIPSQISGNVYAHSATAGALYVEQSFEIYGGTFISETSEGVQTNGNGDVYGGIFISGSETKNGIANYATIRVKGGTFPNTLTTITPYSGYAFFHNAEGTYVPQLDKTIDSYTVKHVIATLGETNYASVKEAIDAANEGDEIVIANAMSDEEAEILTISKSITISNDKTFKGQINVNNGAEVVLTGTGIYDGTLSVNGGTLYTFGGKYTSDPSAFVSEAQGCSCKKEGDYWVVSQVVAKIGNTPYSTLQAAISAATDNAQIDMQVNANMPNSAIVVNKNLTINLNGKTLFATGTKSKLSINTANKTVTIQNGTIAAKPAVKNLETLLEQSAANTLNLNGVALKNENGSYAIVVSKANTALNIDNACVINVGKAAVYASADIKITNNAQLGEVRLANVAATITNNAGASMTLNTSTDNSKAISLTNAGTITINSGYYLGTMALTSGNQVTINGGWFAPAIIDADSKAYTLGANKTSVKKSYKGTEVYQIEENGQSYECSMGEYKYITLREALQANTSTESVEITLLRDCDVDVTADNFYNVKKTDKVVLNLNGKKLHATNNSLNSNINLFNVAGSLTIKDETNNGEITYVDEVGSHNTYVINIVDGGSVIINGGTIANLAEKSSLAWCVEAANGSSIEMNGGKLYAPYSRVIRFFLNGASEASFTMNDGEIESLLGIWIQLPTAQSVVPHLNFTMVNGSMVLTNNEVANAVDILSNYGQAFNELKFNVTGGYIGGAIYLGGGCNFDGLGSEQIHLENGIFDAHNPLVSEYVNGKRDLPHNVISGGAFFFDYLNHTSDPNKYSQFCEYIKPGHYALKMHVVETQGESSYHMTVNGKTYYFDEGIAEDGSFWAVIDAKGKKEAVELTEGENLVWNVSGISGGETTKVVDELTDVIFSGNPDAEAATTKVTVVDSEGQAIKANRLIIEKGAGIIVKDGTTLDIGMGGVVITGDENKKGTSFIWVEPGGTFVSNGTVVSNTEKDVVVFADETGAGTFLISPDVNYNNTPHATVQMHTEVGYDSDWEEYYWHRFAMPVDGIENWDKLDDDGTAMMAPTYLYGWDYNQDDWLKLPNGVKDMTPFNGYTLTHTLPDPTNVNYIFEGDLLGNVPSKLNFKYEGYNFFGNSYTGYIDAKTLLDEIMHVDNKNVKGTIWMWNADEQSYSAASLTELMDSESGLKVWQREVAPMHTFILHLNQSNQSLVNINYANAIWGNPRYSALIEQAGREVSAPQRVWTDNTDRLHLLLTAANGQKDQVRFTKSEDYTDAYEDGADAPKYMNKGCLNVYSTVDGENYTSVYSDELEGKMISFQSLNDIEYTFTFTKVQGNYSLVDTETGITTPIIEGGEYSFVAQPNAVITDRFMIVGTRTIPTDLMQTRQNNAPKGIFTMMGQYIGKTSAWRMLPKGVYMVDGVKLIK